MYAKPKKRLGQNFLIDKNILNKIVRLSQISANDIVIEIGAGRGELTRFLAEKAYFCIAFEIDRSLIADLKIAVALSANVKVVNDDFLKSNIRKEIEGIKFASGKRIVVIGNIPYYITTPIIEHILKHSTYIDTAYLMVQKEFAHRMAAAAGSKDYSSLSCFIGYYCLPRILFTITKNCFRPVPSVDSCFISLKLKKFFSLSKFEEKKCFHVIRAAFSKRRKTLKNCLKGIVAADKISRFLKENNFSQLARGEELSLENFISLSK